MATWSEYPWCIDVSTHQGPIDWERVADTGCQAAWIKVGGSDVGLYRDGRAAYNTTAAAAAGIKWGGYWFAAPNHGDARLQAVAALDAGIAAGQLPPMLDLEVGGNIHGLSGAEIDAWAEEFCHAIAAEGHHLIVYTSANWDFGRSDFLGGCHLWIANYGIQTPGTHPTDQRPSPPLPPAWQPKGWSLWQHNSVTKLDGIPDNTVDVNIVAPEYWSHIMGSGGGMEDWYMKALALPDSAAQWYLSVDGYGVTRRTPIHSQAELAVLVEGGVIENHEPCMIMDDGERAAFEAIPESNPTYTADMGNLVSMVQILKAIHDGNEACDLDPTQIAQALLSMGIGKQIVDALLGALEGAS